MNNDIETKTPKRLRLYLVPEEVVLALLNFNWLEAQCLRIPQSLEIPKDAVVHSVHVDYSRRAFAFMVGHESFDEVNPCIELPVFKLTNHDFQITFHFIKGQING